MALSIAGAPPASIVEGHSSAVGSWALHAGSLDRAGALAQRTAVGFMQILGMGLFPIVVECRGDVRVFRPQNL